MVKRVYSMPEFVQLLEHSLINTRYEAKPRALRNILQADVDFGMFIHSLGDFIFTVPAHAYYISKSGHVFDTYYRHKSLSTSRNMTSANVLYGVIELDVSKYMECYNTNKQVSKWEAPAYNPDSKGGKECKVCKQPDFKDKLARQQQRGNSRVREILDYMNRNLGGDPMYDYK
jgi:hypothetical protein